MHFYAHNMHFRMICLLACVGSLFLVLAIQANYSKIAPTADVASATKPNQSSEQLTLSQLHDRAQSITVKVLAGQGWGSGILIHKQDQVYTVVTNEHVLRLGSTYRIQTPDGKIYPASKDSAHFDDNDLALLRFGSANSYNIANLATGGESANLHVGDEMFAAGFPAVGNGSQGMGFVFTTGQVSYLLPQAFIGGYQVGYSNDIVKGMSGGPVLNRYGEVVAINGKHKYPLWGNTYIFKDGTTPVVQARQQMDYSSWAVPVQTFLQLAPQFSKAAIAEPRIQSPSPVAPIPPDITVEPVSPKTNTGNQQLPRTGSFW